MSHLKELAYTWGEEVWTSAHTKYLGSVPWLPDVAQGAFSYCAEEDGREGGEGSKWGAQVIWLISIE